MRWIILCYAAAVIPAMVISRINLTDVLGEGWSFGLLTQDPITSFYATTIFLGALVSVFQLTAWYGTVRAVPVAIVRWAILDLRPGPLGARGGLAFALVPLAVLAFLSYLVEMFPYALTGAWVVAAFGWRIEIQPPESEPLDDPSFAGPAG